MFPVLKLPPRGTLCCFHLNAHLFGVTLPYRVHWCICRDLRFCLLVDLVLPLRMGYVNTVIFNVIVSKNNTEGSFEELLDNRPLRYLFKCFCATV